MNWATPNERRLFAAVLQEPRTIAEVGGLRREHFQGEQARQVWATIVELDNRQQPVNAIAVARKLHAPALADQIEHMRGLITEGRARAAEAAQYAEMVVDDSVGRTALLAFDEASRALREPASSKREAVAEALAVLQRIEQPETGRHNGLDLLRQLWDDCEKWRLTPEDQRQWPSVRTGFVGLDRATGGLRLGQLHTLGADSSAGKSSFANAVTDNALIGGNCVDVYGYEDEPRAVVARIAARVARISNHHLQSADLNGADPAEVLQAWEGAQDAFSRLEIVHERPSSITDLCLQIREGCARRGTKLVVIDYIQLLKHIGEGRSNYDRLSNITSELFHAARRSGAALLVLSQLSRPQDKTAERRPTMRDIKDCGDIENFSYSVLLLWARRLTMKTDTGGHTHERTLPVVELLVDKNKNGPVGDEARSLLRFDARSTTFYDLEEDDTDRMDYLAVARRGR